MAANNVKKKDYLIHQRVCEWSLQCDIFRKMFAAHNLDDVRGKERITLNLSGDSDSKIKWRVAEFKHLYANPNTIKFVNA